MFVDIRKNIFILLLSLLTACASGSKKFSESQWNRKVEKTEISALYSKHYEEGAFFNPWLRMPENRFWSILTWKFSCAGKYTRKETEFMPRFIPGAAARIEDTGNRDFILWIGHNTYLLRINGKYWLTDPIFSKRALIPSRYFPPPLEIADILKMAGPMNVIITHNHYDHLDSDSIEKLPQRTHFYVPLGLKHFIEDLGKKEVREMDWHQEIQIDSETRLICLPAQHWSRRITTSFNKTLWASYLLISRGKKYYFGGDSGYFKGYREIGKKYPGIDFAFLPTTAYHPRWFMHYAHMNIAEAIKAFHDLGARYFIPTQWGTFKLGDNPPGYPGLDLKREIGRQKLDISRYLIMDIGEIIYTDR